MRQAAGRLTLVPARMALNMLRDTPCQANSPLWKSRLGSMGFGATTIADIYKERWQIELFFKALKQNLKVRSFVGTSENALRIQIWTALIVMLLLKWLHHLSRAGWSLSNLATMLRLNLFTYRELTSWLDDPFNTPPLQPLPVQLELNLR
jgi:IS4 transposase